MLTPLTYLIRMIFQCRMFSLLNISPLSVIFGSTHAPHTGKNHNVSVIWGTMSIIFPSSFSALVFFLCILGGRIKFSLHMISLMFQTRFVLRILSSADINIPVLTSRGKLGIVASPQRSRWKQVRAMKRSTVKGVFFYPWLVPRNRTEPWAKSPPPHVLPSPSPGSGTFG